MERYGPDSYERWFLFPELMVVSSCDASGDLSGTSFGPREQWHQ